jgi:hypothetical protein
LTIINTLLDYSFKMSYSANDNQNYFVQNGRPTSRVLAQPGGQCSISIGGWTPEELERQRQVREQGEAPTQQVETIAEEPKSAPTTTKESSAVVAAVTGKENPVDEVVNKKEEEQVQKPAAAKPAAAKPTATTSSNAFASASSTNSFNVVTDRPTSRVTMPPGGHTSLRLW